MKSILMEGLTMVEQMRTVAILMRTERGVRTWSLEQNQEYEETENGG
jgi:hypothetical protein